MSGFFAGFDVTWHWRALRVRRGLARAACATNERSRLRQDRIILFTEIDRPADLRVHLRAAEFFRIDDLSDRRLHQ